MHINLIINIDNVATGDQDMGRHTVCMSATDEFLEYSKSVGNDLSTPGMSYALICLFYLLQFYQLIAFKPLY